MADPRTEALPLLPLPTGVVLPTMVVTLALETPEARAAADAAAEGDGRLLLVPYVDGRYARVGTVARVDSAGELPNGTDALLLRGLHRARLGAGVAAPEPRPGGEGREGREGGDGGAHRRGDTRQASALWVAAEVVEEGPPTERARHLTRQLRAVVSGLAERRRSRRLPEALASTSDPGTLADTIVSVWSDLAVERKVEALETTEVEARVEKLLAWASEALAELELGDKIRTDVAEGMERTQREFLLRQQLAAIRNELGEGADGEGVVEGYRTRVAASAMPEAVRQAAEREIVRLERTSEQSPEHGWIRTWLDWMCDLPWGVRSEDHLQVAEARALLDADHTGLDEVKDRIIEELAVRTRLAARRRSTTPTTPVAPGEVALESGRGSGMILALVGPPGVGKTSLGESVARALGRRFVRVALGGVRDEAEVRGHRRTYVGALPGRIVRAVKEAGTVNPVVVLDEVDKLGADWRGDPSSALLEVLDPAQNHTFRDHYLEVDLDLSEVLFIATANVAETIPGPLLDRMEVVRLDGYTEDEKVAIARHHLLARQLARNGLDAGEVAVTDAAFKRVVADYTREAGVRTLERELGKLLRKVATRLESGAATAPVRVDVGDVAGYLGRARFFFEAAERTAVPGVATGLAVTGTGGDVLFIEAAALPAGRASAEGSLTLTGQLGDVMKESAEIALSYLRSHAGALGLDGRTAGRRFHVHVPAGAVPKDGPSAGVTMTTALASLLTGRPVRASVGMTGEVTLQGKVLPIGGVKQKVLAAHRAGLTEVVLPARNGPDLDDVPQAVRDLLTFHLVEDVRQVLELALEREPANAEPAPSDPAPSDSAPSDSALSDSAPSELAPA